MNTPSPAAYAKSSRHFSTFVELSKHTSVNQANQRPIFAQHTRHPKPIRHNSTQFDTFQLSSTCRNASRPTKKHNVLHIFAWTPVTPRHPPGPSSYAWAFSPCAAQSPVSTSSSPARSSQRGAPSSPHRVSASSSPYRPTQSSPDTSSASRPQTSPEPPSSTAATAAPAPNHQTNATA